MKYTYAFTITLFISVLFVGCGGGGAESEADQGSNAPQAAAVSLGASQSEWQQRMITTGKKLCDPAKIRELSTWEGNSWYYDGIRVYYQIADYTGDNSFESCAKAVKDVYLPYVLDNGGKIPGWRVFPHGLALDYKRTGDTRSKDAAIALAKNSAFANQGGGAGFELSRETAYLINAYRIAAELGATPSTLAATSKQFALGHIDQWVGSQSASYVKPFMMGLTFEALIGLGDGDPSVLAAIKKGADWLWANAYHTPTQSFYYIVCRGKGEGHTEECDGNPREPAADLNLLVAPAFSWLYLKTGEQKYKDEAISLLDGANRGAFLDQGKQFNQSYRWSFDLIRYLN